MLTPEGTDERYPRKFSWKRMGRESSMTDVLVANANYLNYSTKCDVAATYGLFNARNLRKICMPLT